jgi:hypothetical protein
MKRATKEVFEDHLRESVEGTVEHDLARNYAEDVVILTGRGVYRGHEGIRQLAQLLQEQLPECTFHYVTQEVDGEVAFLEWTADSPRAHIEDGADSYVIRDGRIAVQTIHYTVMPR